MTVITMSRNELTRLRVLIDVADGRLSVADATGLIGVRLGARRVRRQRECHLYFCTPSDISTLRRQLRRMSGDEGIDHLVITVIAL